MTQPPKKPLGPLEHAVMQIVWDRHRATAEDVRAALKRTQEFKESTIRTVLSRLEGKGYLEHDVEGRTYVYRARLQPEHVASRQVRAIVDNLCRGSVENLLVGMVDDELITPEKLRQLADRIAKAEKQQKPARQRKRPPKGSSKDR